MTGKNKLGLIKNILLRFIFGYLNKTGNETLGIISILCHARYRNRSNTILDRGTQNSEAELLLLAQCTLQGSDRGHNLNSSYQNLSYIVFIGMSLEECRLGCHLRGTMTDMSTDLPKRVPLGVTVFEWKSEEFPMYQGPVQPLDVTFCNRWTVCQYSKIPNQESSFKLVVWKQIFFQHI